MKTPRKPDLTVLPPPAGATLMAACDEMNDSPFSVSALSDTDFLASSPSTLREGSGWTTPLSATLGFAFPPNLSAAALPSASYLPYDSPLSHLGLSLENASSRHNEGFQFPCSSTTTTTDSLQRKRLSHSYNTGCTGTFDQQNFGLQDQAADCASQPSEHWHSYFLTPSPPPLPTSGNTRPLSGHLHQRLSVSISSAIFTATTSTPVGASQPKEPSKQSFPSSSETALFDCIPNFTFPQRTSVPSASDVSMQDFASQDRSAPRSVPRQRPDIPSIGQLGGSAAFTLGVTSSSMQHNFSAPAWPDHLFIPQFTGSAAAQIAEPIATHEPQPISAAMSLEPSHDISSSSWLAPPRTPGSGPVSGNRRRSASTGALPSTYCSIPYGIPAEGPVCSQPAMADPADSNLGAAMDQTQSLWDLQDPAEGVDARPHYSLTTLIRYAILGSETQRLTLQEIYEAIEARYAFFRAAGKGWKNSVRHNLSLNKCFKRVNRTLLDPGKGSYWYVDLNEEFSTPRHRNRKRNEDSGRRSRACSLSNVSECEDDKSSVADAQWIGPQGEGVSQDALQPVPVAARLAKTRPRSLSDLTFGVHGEDQEAARYQQVDGHLAPLPLELPPFGRQSQDYAAYQHYSASQTNDFGFPPSTQQSDAAEESVVPSFNQVIQQALQISNIEGSSRSYRPADLDGIY